MNVENGQLPTIYYYLDEADKTRTLTIGKGDNVTVLGTFLRTNVSGLHFDLDTFDWYESAINRR